MSFERPLLSTLSTELFRPTPVIHVLIGPRQVGKTTIARRTDGIQGVALKQTDQPGDPGLPATAKILSTIPSRTP